MYIIGILLMCILSIIVGPIDAISSFKEGRVVVAIIQIVVTLLLMVTAIILFMIHDNRGDFELDVTNEDDKKTVKMKTISGYIFSFSVILIVALWFCRLCDRIF